MGIQARLSFLVLLVSIVLYVNFPYLAETLSTMPSLAAVRASNAAFKHSISPLPVAVFVGGTSGIGQGMAEVFANNTQGNSHIVIVGRNKDAAEKIFAGFPKPSVEGASTEFVQCDVTLMKNVDKAAKDILQRHSKINYLVMTPGVMTLNGRDETEEGIDKKMAVHYYARWKFLDGLLPALKKASEDGEKVAVMSVLAPGKGGSIYMDDLELKNFTIAKAALVAPTYNDMMMESFAGKAPKIPFIHAYPGFVRTPLMNASNSWLLRNTATALLTLTRPLSVTGAQCGEYMWRAIYGTAVTPGAWRTGSNGEDLKKANYHGTPEERMAVWEHTAKTMREALERK